MFKLDYGSVTCIGGDLPCLNPDLIGSSFAWLAHEGGVSSTGAMVLVPCQAAGVSLVGVTKSVSMDFSGVFYNPNGCSALDALIQFAGSKKIHTALFEALREIYS